MSGTIVSPRLRTLSTADRGRVEAITRAVGLFREDEIPVALEVFDEAMRAGSSAGSYQVLGADVDGSLSGWICWGPTPCTLATFDMYWLVVDPRLQGAGIGTTLVAEMERRLAGVARLIVVETAGRFDFASTRAFYAARGYQPTSTIPDFYAPGDDQVVFVKYMNGVRGER